MAENMQVNDRTGQGKTVAADEIGGVLYQRTKVVIGDDGANGGDVSYQNPMPVHDDDVIENLTFIKNPETGEINTIDDNVRMVLGTERLVTNGKLNVNAIPEYRVQKNILATVTNAVQMIDVTGQSSLAIQVLGSWTGTLTFECSLDGGTFIPIYGIAINGVSILSSCTANGIYRFNVAGLTKVQVRFSVATTGNPIILFIASPEPSSIIVNPVTGSQTAPLSQKATTLELNTYDTNLAAMTTPQAKPAIIAPVAPTLPASYLGNLFSKLPQIFPRLKVESGGDKQLPFAQEDNTWKLKTSDDEIRVLLQEILLQVTITNNLYIQELDGMVNGLKIPDGLKEVL